LNARLLRQVGQKITQLIEQHQPARWSFAAPAEINGAILQQLSPECLQKLSHNLKRDLVKTEPRGLLPYFDGATR
jgi:hypothetical protein